MRTLKVGSRSNATGQGPRGVAAAIAAAALLTLSLGAATAAADGARDHRDAENTFTKWRTTEAAVPPVLVHMAGVVGGDVGDGTFAGEVLSLSVVGTTKTIDAAYHFSGSDHAFSAAVHVVQSGLVNGSTAEITGRVTSGWLKDSPVAGEYTQVTCEQAPGVSGTCFTGTLDILRGATPQRPFHLDKTCADAPSEPLGYICTVQDSDFRWIPAGTDVHYLSQAGNVVQAAIRIRNGTTRGACVWSSDVDAVCTFDHGTGRLAEFHLVVVVTANADQSMWYWDGTYWFGG